MAEKFDVEGECARDKLGKGKAGFRGARGDSRSHGIGPAIVLDAAVCGRGGPAPAAISHFQRRTILAVNARRQKPERFRTTVLNFDPDRLNSKAIEFGVELGLGVPGRKHDGANSHVRAVLDGRSLAKRILG